MVAEHVHAAGLAGEAHEPVPRRRAECERLLGEEMRDVRVELREQRAVVRILLRCEDPSSCSDSSNSW
jgi:hypothetical protein